MNNKDIKKFFSDIRKLNISYEEKVRMINKLQVRGTNKINKTMTYKNLCDLLEKQNANISSLILGPKWNKLVFVDINIEI